MNLQAVITHLRERLPVFERRVAGAAQFQVLPEAATLQLPYAFVVPLDENPDANQSSNGYLQTVDDSFAVIVVLDNKVDERGQGAATGVHDMRKLLFQVLLGWRPDDDYAEVEYDGGSLLRMDRARLYYQFEFKSQYTLDVSDTWYDVRNRELPAFTGVDVKLDAVDPADPNHPKTDFPDDPGAYQGGNPGPDGRAEGSAKIDLPQT
jgi:hypothetical protein